MRHSACATASRPPAAASKAAFVACVERIASTLGVATPKRALATVAVLGPAPLPSAAALRACGLSRPASRLAAQRARRGHSSFWPLASVVVLARRAPSHLAEEAGHFLRHSHAPFAAPASLQDAFYLHTVEEALAFFASKLICPSRRPLPLGAALGARQTSRHAAEVASSVQAHLALAAGGRAPGRLFSSDPSVSHEVCHLLGYRLGQALFAARASGACDPRKVAALFVRRTSGEHEALLLYWQLTGALRHFLPRPPRARCRRFPLFARKELS